MSVPDAPAYLKFWDLSKWSVWRLCLCQNTSNAHSIAVWHTICVGLVCVMVHFFDFQFCTFPLSTSKSWKVGVPKLTEKCDHSMEAYYHLGERSVWSLCEVGERKIGENRIPLCKISRNRSFSINADHFKMFLYFSFFFALKRKHVLCTPNMRIRRFCPETFLLRSFF